MLQDVTAPCWTHLEQHQGNIQGCFSLLSLRLSQEAEKNKTLGVEEWTKACNVQNLLETSI